MGINTGWGGSSGGGGSVSLIGSASTASIGTTLDVNLSETIGANALLKILVEITLNGSVNPDLMLTLNSGARYADYAGNFYGGSHNASYTGPRIARTSSGGSDGQLIVACGELYIPSASTPFYHGSYKNSLVAQYGNSCFALAASSEADFGSITLESTVSNAFKAAKIFVWKTLLA